MIFTVCVLCCLQCFDTVGWKGIRPVKTEWWGAGMVICLERGADLHMAQLVSLPLTVSCFSKSRLVLSFWYRLTWVDPDKGPLNACVCVLHRLPPDCHHPSRDPHHCHFGRCPPCRQPCGRSRESCQHRCAVPCHSAVWRRRQVCACLRGMCLSDRCVLA